MHSVNIYSSSCDALWVALGPRGTQADITSVGIFNSSIRISEEHPQNSNPKWHKGGKKLDVKTIF